jgi:signal transduction histidine kinase
MHHFKHMHIFGIQFAKIRLKCNSEYNSMHNQSRNKIIEQERLAAIDEIIVTINHKINNPLTTIINYAEILKSMMQTPNHIKIQESLKSIIDAALQIKKIIFQLSLIQSTDTSQYLPNVSMINLPED